MRLSVRLCYLKLRFPGLESEVLAGAQQRCRGWNLRRWSYGDPGATFTGLGERAHLLSPEIDLET